MQTALNPVGGLITAQHPYFRNLPAAHEHLSCPCGVQAVVLLLIPGHRLERCGPCYRDLVLYLDPACTVVHIGCAPNHKDVLSVVSLLHG